MSCSILFYFIVFGAAPLFLSSPGFGLSISCTAIDSFSIRFCSGAYFLAIIWRGGNVDSCDVDYTEEKAELADDDSTLLDCSSFIWSVFGMGLSSACSSSSSEVSELKADEFVDDSSSTSFFSSSTATAFAFVNSCFFRSLSFFFGSLETWSYFWRCGFLLAAGEGSGFLTLSFSDCSEVKADLCDSMSDSSILTDGAFSFSLFLLLDFFFFVYTVTSSDVCRLLLLFSTEVIVLSDCSNVVNASCVLWFFFGVGFGPSLVDGVDFYFYFFFFFSFDLALAVSCGFGFLKSSFGVTKELKADSLTNSLSEGVGAFYWFSLWF